MRFLTRLAAVAAAMLALAGAPAAQAQEKSTWDAIKERGTLRIGVTQSPPWYFKDSATGTWSGVGVKMGSQMAETLGVKPEFVETTWGNAVAGLQANQLDLMFVLDATPERAMAVDFPASPLLYYALAVMHAEDKPVTSWAEMNTPETSIAVAQGTSIDAFVTRTLDKAEIQRYPGHSEAVAAFQSGRADYVSMFHPALISFRQKLGRGAITLPTPVRASPSSVGVRKEADKTFRDWVNVAIAYYYGTGRTQDWFEEFLTEFKVDPKSVPAVQRELWN